MSYPLLNKGFNMKFKLSVLFLIIVLFVFEGCSTCPGSQNFVSPRFYRAIDFMKYPYAGEFCILSKTWDGNKSQGVWSTRINEKDFFMFRVSDYELMYFKLTHVAVDYEDIRWQFNRYMSYFKRHGTLYRHAKKRANFTCEYLNWSVHVNLSGRYLRITCLRI